ncbi:hypothetical protein SAY87_003427 [Trapa incisa]|uniref:Ubiquitin-like domain-containing protein n=1 Tax=Trapa incisa TaxID=236973 RepID=A0AAN7QHN9_9MYRT|nr:hypothetical protein SAY87_003427 [Trapa incisa]
MMKMTSGYLHGHPKGSSMATSSSSADEAGEWEMRPGGMLVQKRSASSTAGVTALNLRLRIAHGAIKLEISVSSQATFGEVKKILATETGLHPAEQRLIFRGRERRNGEYLDTSGVKDRSKLVLVQDPVSIERRFIEMRRNTRIQSALRAISDVSVEVDQLAEQVSAIEKATATGNKVREVQITTLIEILMRQAIKLDGISAEGDAASLKNLQVGSHYLTRITSFKNSVSHAAMAVHFSFSGEESTEVRRNSRHTENIKLEGGQAGDRHDEVGDVRSSSDGCSSDLPEPIMGEQ